MAINRDEGSPAPVRDRRCVGLSVASAATTASWDSFPAETVVVSRGIRCGIPQSSSHPFHRLDLGPWAPLMSFAKSRTCSEALVEGQGRGRPSRSPARGGGIIWANMIRYTPVREADEVRPGVRDAVRIVEETGKLIAQVAREIGGSTRARWATGSPAIVRPIRAAASCSRAMSRS